MAVSHASSVSQLDSCCWGVAVVVAVVLVRWLWSRGPLCVRLASPRCSGSTIAHSSQPAVAVAAQKKKKTMATSAKVEEVAEAPA